MREIKFRCWNGEMNEMLPVVTLGFDNEGILKSQLMYSGPIMQYTGLKDKKGKEIYEGDVVRQKFMEFETGAITIESTRGTVVGSSPIWPHDCEVIGNIYENPELLK